MHFQPKRAELPLLKNRRVGLFNSQVNQAQFLLRAIDSEYRSDPISFLFGYTFGSLAFPVAEQFLIPLKKQFNNVQELFEQEIISKNNLVLLIIEALDFTSKCGCKTDKQKLQKFSRSFQQNGEEIMMNPEYIMAKWERREQIEAENEVNYLALQKLLSEEAKQNKIKAEKAEQQGWECQICLTDMDKAHFGILECGHLFHPECINGYLKSSIESNQIDIKCPMEDCGKFIVVNDIMNYIDGELRQKYDKFSFNHFVEKNNTSTSWCPTAGCPAVFQFDEKLDNYRCPACSKHYCLRCRCPYHTGMSCKQYQINNSFGEADKAFLHFVKGAKFKQCPKCNYWVERRQGCSTMTCKCGQQFCYECGGTGCPHGSCSGSGKKKK